MPLVLVEFQELLHGDTEQFPNWKGREWVHLSSQRSRQPCKLQYYETFHNDLQHNPSCETKERQVVSTAFKLFSPGCKKILLTETNL